MVALGPVPPPGHRRRSHRVPTSSWSWPRQSGDPPTGSATGSAAFTEASKRNSIFGAGGHPAPPNGTRGFQRETASLAALVLLVGLTFTSRGPAALKRAPRVPQDERSRTAMGDPMADFSARWRPLHRSSISAVLLNWHTVQPRPPRGPPRCDGSGASGNWGGLEGEG
jgi:hypothetical protein